MLAVALEGFAGSVQANRETAFSGLAGLAFDLGAFFGYLTGVSVAEIPAVGADDA